MNQRERREFLIKELLKEDKSFINIKIPESEDNQKKMLRGLMNIRSPRSISKEFLKIQDEYLNEENLQKGIVDVNEISEIEKGISLWQGDITRLKCDAIVNAGNSGLTGCYYPNHNCIDNCIHTYAGIQLRLECNEIIKKQGHEEKTGSAKITRGYNLPAKYVIHTVGPIIYERVRKEDEILLESCYRSSLELASRYNLENIVFCCISTGEFRFPNYRAGKIAVNTVRDFMKSKSSIKKVIFNVFKDIDKEIYRELLG